LSGRSKKDGEANSVFEILERHDRKDEVKGGCESLESIDGLVSILRSGHL
jgi:hypothetical protein